MTTRSEGFTDLAVPEAYDRFMGRQVFEPWARDLVDRARLASGACVLDVASGAGPVARAAAAAVGPEGRVVASDVSPAMLAVSAAKPSAPGSAPIEFVECAADALAAADASFDAAFCQQGLQFFPDPVAAARELRRVLTPGGVALVSVWAAERPVGLFGPMLDALVAAGVEPPYPRAFDPDSYALASDELAELFGAGGFAAVEVETVELDCAWESGEDALSAVGGTPFAPAVAALPPADRERFRADFAQRLGAGTGRLSVRTAANVARATA